jgi:hypothetical protein
MSIEVEAVAASGSSHRRWKRLPGAVFATLTLLLAAACSSKNPDSLIGMNLDENYAVLDANATLDAVPDASDAVGNAVATSGDDRVGRTGDAAASGPNVPTRGSGESASQVDPSGAEADNPPDEKESGANQVIEEDEPNGV